MKTSIIAPSRFVARSRTPLGGSLRRAAVCKGGLKGGRRATVRCTLAPLVREPGVAEGSLPVLSFVDRVDGSSSQDTFVVGSGDSADIRVPGDNVCEAHAKLELKYGRVFCTAMSTTGDGGESRTWIDGKQILGGVRYLVAPGSTLAFGAESSLVVIEFIESGGVSGMLRDLILSWAEECGEDSRAEVKKFFSEMD